MQQYVYSSFGKIEGVFDGAGVDVTAAPPVDNPYGYTSREIDSESELYFYRARYYDSSTGRFVSEDKLNILSGDTNFYRYVENDPLGAVDPFGFSKCDVRVALQLVSEVLGEAGLSFEIGTSSSDSKGSVDIWGVLFSHMNISSEYLGELSPNNLRVLLTTVFHETLHIKTGYFGYIRSGYQDMNTRGLGEIHTKIHKKAGELAKTHIKRFRSIIASRCENKCE